MVNAKIFALRVIRDFFETVWFHPSAWLYWDKKVLKAREDAKRNDKV